MNRIAVFLAVGLALFGPALLGAQSAVDLSDPVATAVLPLPENLREGATVIDQATETILRQGNNGFTCLADLPGNDRLSLQCHPSIIEPYMRRGRELSSKGIRGSEQRSVLAAEIRTGRLYLPSGAMLRNLLGRHQRRGRCSRLGSRLVRIPVPLRQHRRMGDPGHRPGPRSLDDASRRRGDSRDGSVSIRAVERDSLIATGRRHHPRFPGQSRRKASAGSTPAAL